MQKCIDTLYDTRQQMFIIAENLWSTARVGSAEHFGPGSTWINSAETLLKQ